VNGRAAASRAVLVAGLAALATCAQSEPNPAADSGAGGSGGLNCQQIRMCVFGAPCADDACIQSCAARGTVDAQAAFGALRACTANACATSDINCACDEQCQANGACLSEADACRGTAPVVDDICDSLCA
jgi:hypothetical protein